MAKAKTPRKKAAPAAKLAGTAVRLTVLAQDPSLTSDGKNVVTTKVEVPAEALRPGPHGHRIRVVDYDATADVYYGADLKPGLKDRYDGVTNLRKLLNDPHFHQQNVYALAANTLMLFERALGRRVSWAFGFGTHELKILPHAFAEDNAYFSNRDEALMFGYFDNGGKTVYTCLSRDIVVHETAHALLDALKADYSRPSSPDQAAFHEGYSDAIALLSVLSSEEFLLHELERSKKVAASGTALLTPLIASLTVNGFLMGLGEEFGVATDSAARDALRRSLEIPRGPQAYPNAPDEAHDRGEYLVAPLLVAFLEVWKRRLRSPASSPFPVEDQRVEAWRVAEEGAKSAQHLLRMIIRALDYLPPAHVTFRDFLSAFVTADVEACPDDTRYGYRAEILQAFAQYGVLPESGEPGGFWEAPLHPEELDYNAIRLDGLRSDRETASRFLYDNAERLGLCEHALTVVKSVRPVTRVGSDGFVLRETVAEYNQTIFVTPAEMKSLLKLTPPKGSPAGRRFGVHGGGSLIFDEGGRLKYHVRNRIDSPRQRSRIAYLSTHEGGEGLAARRFARLHRHRALGVDADTVQSWP